MTDVVSTLSDRLLAVFVPSGTAEASPRYCLEAPPDPCGCSGGTRYLRKCMKCSDGWYGCTQDCPLREPC
ncbi:hypothetical protein WEH80_38525 [Actinomycetes bacterium KLBMP 9759]